MRARFCLKLHLCFLAGAICEFNLCLVAFLVVAVAPRNILLDASGRCVICDYGLAKHMHPGNSGAGPAPYYKMTSEAMLPLPWMAPESMPKPHLFNAKTDIWSMGVLFWQLMTGQRMPYAGAPDIMIGLVTGSLDLRPSLLTSEDWLPVSTVARDCLDRDPARRPSAADAAQRLRAAQRVRLEQDSMAQSGFHTTSVRVAGDMAATDGALETSSSALPGSCSVLLCAQPVVWDCTECGLSFCTSCSEEAHLPIPKRNHQRVPRIQQPALTSPVAAVMPVSHVMAATIPDPSDPTDFPPTGTARAMTPSGAIASVTDAGSAGNAGSATLPAGADELFASSERLRLSEAARKRQTAKQASITQRAAMSRQGPLDKKRDTFFSLGFKTRQFQVSFYDTPFIRYYLDNALRTPSLPRARF